MRSLEHDASERILGSGSLVFARVLLEQGDFAAAEQIFESVFQAPAFVPTPADCYDYALACFASCHDQDALRLINQALKLDDRFASAYQLRGLLDLRSGLTLQALQAFERVVELEPRRAEGHYLRADALVVLGRHQEALVGYAEALDLRPLFPEALCNLGCLRRLLGQSRAAIEILQQAIELRPSFPAALSALGLALYDCGELGRAEQEMRKVLEIDPAFVDAYVNLGQILQGQSRGEEAKELYRCALAIKKVNPEAMNNLGTYYEQRGDYLRARALYRRALEARPDYGQALANLGNAYEFFGDRQVARGFYERAIAVDAAVPEFHYNLGLSCHRQGDAVSAIASYERALQLSPGFVKARWNKALCCFYLNDFESAWRAHEARLDSPEFRKLCVEPDLPLWDGRPLSPGLALLLVSEQGLGDTVQFSRYARYLRDRGVAVQLCVPESLVSLLEASDLASAVIPPTAAPSVQEGYWLPLMSVPLHLGVRPDRPLISAPYLSVDPERVRFWREQLEEDGKPVVAINWQGNPDAEISLLQGRSLPLELFRPLVEAFDFNLLSLQKGPGSEQLLSCSFSDRFVSGQHRVDAVWDFQETAAILASCDLVITSDTMVAHLAAAVGVRTWLLLHHLPDWRWGLQGDSSFWYPSMRLFRQSVQGDWSGVIAQVRAAMEDILGFRRKAPTPTGFLAAFWAWVEQTPSSVQASELQQAQASGPDSHLAQRPPSQDAADCSSDPQSAVELPDLVDLQDVKRELAHICLQKGRIEVAKRLCEELLDSGDTQPSTLACMGAVSLLEQNDHDAIRFLTEALSLQPDFAEALSNLGTAHYRQGDIEKARSLFEKALSLSPGFADAHCNLAILRQAEGDLATAMTGHRTALSFDPSHGRAHLNLAYCLFLAGDYALAWKEYEWRLQDAPERKLHAMPLGSPLGVEVDILTHKGALLLVGEQGMGDTLQFLRYVSVLVASGCQVSLCLPKRLHRLVQASMDGIEVLNPDQVREHFSGDWLSLMSLPLFLAESPAHPLVQTPYLFADDVQAAIWRERLCETEGMIVALNWQGNPSAENGTLKGRSLSLEAFSPLAVVEGLRFLSLQKGFGSDQLQSCTFRDRFVDCQNLINEAWDFLEVSAILASTDLVITSDTAVAHLAGAMGHPTWLLLHYVPDWRWGLEGDTTFWYPSVRLFRQREPGNWDEVMQRVASALQEFLAARPC